MSGRGGGAVVDVGATRRDQAPEAVVLWAQHVDRLRAIAYRLLGSVTDTEDVLQDVFLRLQGTDTARIREPAAWLTTVVTRLCINQLSSARARRETYVGPWLPEPIATSPDPADDAVLVESVDAAFLVVLEALTPAERVAFVLHDVFGHPFAEVAVVLGREEVACRRLASRARKAIEARRPRFNSDPAQRRTVSQRFLAACEGRDLDGLLRLLAPDVTLVSDGGGKVRAALNEIHGADRVARFLVGVLTKRTGTERTLPSVHGAPGMAWHDADGHLVGVLSTSVDADGSIATVSIVLNPDKLGHLGTDRERRGQAFRQLTCPPRTTVTYGDRGALRGTAHNGASVCQG